MIEATYSFRWLSVAMRALTIVWRCAQFWYSEFSRQIAKLERAFDLEDERGSSDSSRRVQTEFLFYVCTPMTMNASCLIEIYPPYAGGSDLCCSLLTAYCHCSSRLALSLKLLRSPYAIDSDLRGPEPFKCFTIRPIARDDKTLWITERPCTASTNGPASVPSSQMI